MATAPLEQLKEEHADEIKQAADERIRWIEELTQRLSAATARGVAELHESIEFARDVHRLREALTPDIMRAIEALKGTPLGFATDEKTRGSAYTPAELKEFAIEALANGYRLVGNEVNLIAGRCYAAKAGCVRKVKGFPGLTNLRCAYSPPTYQRDAKGALQLDHQGNAAAIVECRAEWMMRGQAQELVGSPGAPNDGRLIPIRVNKGMGVDGVLGKACRKLNAAIYEQITGVLLAEGEPDDVAPADSGKRAPKPAVGNRAVRAKLGIGGDDGQEAGMGAGGGVGTGTPEGSDNPADAPPCDSDEASFPSKGSEDGADLPSEPAKSTGDANGHAKLVGKARGLLLRANPSVSDSLLSLYPIESWVYLDRLSDQQLHEIVEALS